MRKGIPLFIFSSLFLLAPLTIYAEEIKLGYVDLQRALNDSEAGKTAKEKFKGEVDKAEQSLEKRKNEVEKLKESLRRRGFYSTKSNVTHSNVTIATSWENSSGCTKTCNKSCKSEIVN